VLCVDFASEGSPVADEFDSLSICVSRRSPDSLVCQTDITVDLVRSEKSQCRNAVPVVGGT
jgi:hypothetical protein